MQIIVCVREALDWDLSTKHFRIDPVTHEVAVSFPRYRIDQFDEIAVEVALQYRANTACTIRALCVGKAESEDMLKHVLGMQVDAATLVEMDAPCTAPAVWLAAAIRRDGDSDIVLCGRTSSDHGTGQTGPVLAELLGRPFIGNVIRIEGASGDWRCTRETRQGYELMHCTVPFVATVTNAEHSVARVPTMKHVMQAHRIKIEVLLAATLGDTGGVGAWSDSLRVVRRYVPVNLKGCRYLTGAAREQAAELAAYLRNALPDTASQARTA